MNEFNAIRNKLGIGILPYTLSAEELKNTFDWKLYHWYAYTKEFLPVLTGVGISSPVLGYLYTNNLPTSISVAGMGVLGIISAIMLGLLRVRAGSEEVIKRILGQKKILREFKKINNDIRTAVTDNFEETMPKLIQIQQEIIKVVNVGIQDGSWPYDEGVKRDVEPRALQRADNLLQHLPQEARIRAVAVNELPEQRI